MIEKSWLAIAPQAFTANGTAYGVVTLASTVGFFTKQLITLKGTALPQLALQVKRVNSDGLTLVVGPQDGDINHWTNISAYTTAASATIEAAEQRRVTISLESIARAVYAEEPIVATRVVLVDDKGNILGTAANPLHTI